MKRRTFIKTVPIAALPGLSGCSDSGSVSAPEVGLVKEEVAGRDVPRTRLESVDQSGITITNTVYVDNRENSVGGEVGGVVYQAFWGDPSDDSWSYLGIGEMESFDIPAGEIVYQTARTTLTEGEEIGKMASYVGSGNSAQMWINGGIGVGIGPISTQLYFDETTEVSL